MGKIVGIIQARNGSKRLPFKSIAPLGGKPLLHVYIERVKQSGMLDDIVLATTWKPEDDSLVSIAEMTDIKYYRGPENDLVDRIYWCAMLHNADIVVRLCADNPLIEPSEIDRIVNYHMSSGNDFSSNTHDIDDNGYPDGLGAEVYEMDTLKYLALNAKGQYREHPHMTIYENRDKFKVGTVKCPKELSGHSHLKLDVNTQEEYFRVKEIYERHNGDVRAYLCTLR